MGALDLAGVIGTWVATGLAFIALAGILTPFLIWRAAHTERNRAISAIGPNSFGFVTRGIPLWPGIRLGHKVRAPNLHKTRKFVDEEWKTFDAKRMPAFQEDIPESSASWTQFGAFLLAYGVTMEKTADVVVSESVAMLPVSRAFLFAFALVGRISDDTDRRRKIRTEGGARKWDRRGSSLINRSDIELGMLRVASHLGKSPKETIHGLTGSLLFFKPYRSPGDTPSSSWSAVFVAESLLKPLEIEPDQLPLAAMALLSIGFLPFHQECFINFLEPLEETAGIDSDDDADSVEVGRGYRRRLSIPKQQDGGHRRSQRTRRNSRGTRSRPPVRPKTWFQLERSRKPVVAYELLEIIVSEAEVLNYFPVPADSKYLALYEMKLDNQSRSQLYDIADQTYVPASAPWVRLSGGDSSADYFIRREDIQRIAASVLDLPWHPEGYLLPGISQDNGRGKVITLLCSLALRARPFVVRMKEGADMLDLNINEKKEFIEKTEFIIRKTASSPTRHALLQLLFRFDVFVATLEHENADVQQAIKILTLTNDEFANLVYHSARHLSSNASSLRVEYDTRSGILTIPGLFGTVQTFEIDVAVLKQSQLQLGSRGIISLKHSDVLKVALRAYLRSLVLSSCYDAEPLTSCFENVTSDVLYMS
ncbi:hypothetical protein ASPZODRAFT_16552 [Penicilliopsis zonata CBS 506.65]|uniref:Uncharacterized protein n=1 Tax=Penicilliopsis zonata CBS 506.65 TaxID=1073090 RepID=A0A1L9SI73_9EURO|nr:hypothetical protein ASPZODRAFT_16552 [Penicilliopsis zonata CBS 506.65]OJJ46803.1 hypothetical protein ASPZODRAFT_16552 [Penicilliopsis zonata CBS 506.65]